MYLIYVTCCIADFIVFCCTAYFHEGLQKTSYDTFADNLDETYTA